MKNLFFFIYFIVFFIFSNVYSENSFGTVFFNGKNFVFKNIYNTSGVAFANFKDEINEKGISSLILKTNAESLKDLSWYEKDRKISYAVGFLEGILTQKRILSHYKNLKLYTWKQPGKEMPNNVKQYFLKQKNWIENKINENRGDFYYENVANVHLQYLGLIEGYNSVVKNESEKIDYFQMMILNAFGDIMDIIDFTNNSTKKFNSKNPFLEMKIEDIENYIIERQHCSGLVSLTKDRKDLIFAHNSWFTYVSMTKIFKDFSIHFENELIHSNRIQFSSYPGNIASNDDFIITDYVFAMETTNNIFNLDLYKYSIPESLSCWARSLIASRIANNVDSWIKYFTIHNSGTYNNQYTVVNLKIFKPGMEKLPNGFIKIVEQIPGSFEVNDVTQFLNDNLYWPSYNVPFSEKIRKISGYDDLLKKRPEMKDFCDYKECFRSKIFKRDHIFVQTIDDMEHMIMKNDYLNDPFSKKDPGFSISSRFDLRSQEPNKVKCMGGLDGKVSSAELWKERNVWFKVGPTNYNVETFKFKENYCSIEATSTEGLPKTWNFEWVKF